VEHHCSDWVDIIAMKFPLEPRLKTNWAKQAKQMHLQALGMADGLGREALLHRARELDIALKRSVVKPSVTAITIKFTPGYS